MKTGPYLILGSLLVAIAAWHSGCTKGDPQEVDQHRQQIIAQRTAKDKWFKNPYNSPLTKEQVLQFKGLNYYPVDYKYRVEARFENIVRGEQFVIQTSTDEQRIYVKNGRLHFTLNGEALTLMTYQDRDLALKQEHQDKLFVPFTDESTGTETYGGGRYLDLERPAADAIIVDFNQAYNPYCAYNSKYSCPIPPAENHLPIPIPAGEKKYNGK